MAKAKKFAYPPLPGQKQPTAPKAQLRPSSLTAGMQRRTTGPKTAKFKPMGKRGQ